MTRPTSILIYREERKTILYRLIEQGQRVIEIAYHEPPPLTPSPDPVAMGEKIAVDHYRFSLVIEEFQPTHGDRQVWIRITDDAGETMEVRPMRYSELTCLSTRANRG